MPKLRIQSDYDYNKQIQIDNGSILYHGYGTGVKEDTDLSKTESGYVFVASTDGTFLEKPMREVGGVWATVSGSTTSGGLLGVTHSMGVAPKHITATYHGSDYPYTIAATNIGVNTLDFKFYTGSAVLNAGAVTMSYIVKA